ncbi:hypothetical protein [Asticcacaulis excentricus]|uniref:Uncharacterized protein n=1 Tax=Asticcacaulis excentricus (strain ATCC 15261 / DSM 4724 / KCTC 12464 / NCIMB 9791 / VKM B-1370 / CB 48) TaxID=573065 RepID=E8RN86_ASTEC|nr:hypothetical protein [Asticcacaulis excentricus]ADU13985.1 hypothetical protein Astex_2332 [Asticcacaulis excentricus CB 48]
MEKRSAGYEFEADKETERHSAAVLFHPHFWSQRDVTAPLMRIPLSQARLPDSVRAEDLTLTLGRVLNEIARLETLRQLTPTTTSTEASQAADALSDYVLRLFEMRHIKTQCRRGMPD